MNYKEYKHIVEQNNWSETRAVKHHLANAVYWNKKYKEALELMTVGVLNYEAVYNAYENKVNEIHKALTVAKFENINKVSVWEVESTELNDNIRPYVLNKRQEQLNEFEAVTDSYHKELLTKIHKEME